MIIGHSRPAAVEREVAERAVVDEERAAAEAVRAEREAAATDTAAFDSLACARRQLSQPTHSQDITPSRSFKHG